LAFRWFGAAIIKNAKKYILILGNTTTSFGKTKTSWQLNSKKGSKEQYWLKGN